MGLEKAIASGQEYRKPYHGAKAVCFNCRNHGTCDYCKGNRLYGTRKREAAADAQQEEYEVYICGGVDPPTNAFFGHPFGREERKSRKQLKTRCNHKK